MVKDKELVCLLKRDTRHRLVADGKVVQTRCVLNPMTARYSNKIFNNQEGFERAVRRDANRMARENHRGRWFDYSVVRQEEGNVEVEIILYE